MRVLDPVLALDEADDSIDLGRAGKTMLGQ